MNKAIIIGNVGKDPEVRKTSGGSTVANLTVATTKRWKSQDGQKQEKTEWHNVVIWGKLADVVAQYVTKGMKVMIEGEIETRSWDDNGQKRYKTEINGQQLEMLSGGNPSQPKSQPTEPQYEDRDLPF